MFKVGDRVKHVVTKTYLFNEGTVTSIHALGGTYYAFVQWDSHTSLAHYFHDLASAVPEQIEDWRLPRV